MCHLRPASASASGRPRPSPLPGPDGLPAVRPRPVVWPLLQHRPGPVRRPHVERAAHLVPRADEPRRRPRRPWTPRPVRAAFGMEPLDWQRDYLREDRPTVVLKGRQVGRQHRPRRPWQPIRPLRAAVNAVIVSPSLKQCTEIADTARAGLREAGRPPVRTALDAPLPTARASSACRAPRAASAAGRPGCSSSTRRPTSSRTRSLAARGHWWRPAAGWWCSPRPPTRSGDYHELVTGDDPDWAKFAVRSDEVPTISPEFLERAPGMGPDDTRGSTSASSARPAPSLFSIERVNNLLAVTTINVGVVIVDRGAAVVTVERHDDELLCTGIERFPFDLADVAARVRSLDPETHVVIDAEGMGSGAVVVGAAGALAV